MLELSRGRAVTPSSPAGEAKTRERGKRMIMRMIWSFWGGSGSQSECLSSCQANARVNKQPFPPVGTEKRKVGQDDGEKRSVGRHFRGIWDLFMLVPHIIVLICLNQSEPRGVRRIHLLSLGPSIRGIIIYFKEPELQAVGLVVVTGLIWVLT